MNRAYCDSRRVCIAFMAMLIGVFSPGVWADPAEQPAPGVVYLLTDRDPKDPGLPAPLERELYRQAFLIAARDGLGLQTRDQSLREWKDNPPAAAAWTFAADRRGVRIITPGGDTAWRDIPYVLIKEQDVLPRLVQCESLSRNDFVKQLKNAGFSGNADRTKPGASVPPNLLALADYFDELSQFAVIRQAHGLIRDDGESEARLGVLVRGYANLGQLTRFHWSVEHQVFAARSLLYAQRMVANDPKSPIALWHRAYAMAMAGWPAQALTDLSAAKQLAAGKAPPPWVALLEPLCRYDFEALASIAAKDKAQAPLARFFAFLTLEHSGCQAATLSVEQSALNSNPGCLRLIDAMCNIAEPEQRDRMVDQGPALFSKTLGDELDKLPGLPAAIVDSMGDLQDNGGNYKGPEHICEQLIDAGAPEHDSAEPSWAVLGREIQETTFALVRRKAEVIAVEWGADASDFVAGIQPLIAGHRFKGVIDAYGALHESTLAHAAEALHSIEWYDLTVAELPYYRLEQTVESRGEGTQINLISEYMVQLDVCSFDREAWCELYGLSSPKATLEDTFDFLPVVSPQSPWIICGQILYHWDPNKAATWEASPRDYPSIQEALGRRYAELHQWQDAERCMKAYLAVSPDRAGYRALADVYQSQGRDDLWLSTLEDYLNNTPDDSSDHAKVQKQIAEHFMDEGKFKDALPYADATADTQWLEGILCAARAHTGSGDFDGAEQLYLKELDSYSDSPFMWYTWCVETGHGRLADARKALDAYFAAQGQYPASEVLLQKALVDFVDGKTASAISEMKERYWQSPGPLSILHILAFADDANDRAARNQALLRRWSYLAPEQDLIKLATLLGQGYRAGNDGRINLKAIDTILATADGCDRITINYLTANYLNKRGHKDLAAWYVKRCYTGFSGYCCDRLLVDTLAHTLGLNTLQLSSEPTVADDATIDALKSAYQIPPRPAFARRPFTGTALPSDRQLNLESQPLNIFTLALGIGEGKIPFLAIVSLCAAIGLIGFALRRITITATRELRGLPMYIAAALFCLPLLSWLLLTHLSAHTAPPTAEHYPHPLAWSTVLAIIWTPILAAIVLSLATARPKPSPAPASNSPG